MANNRLPRWQFKYVENVIYDLEDMKRRLSWIKYDIIHRTPEKHEIRSPDPSDPTGIAATLLAMSVERKRLEEHIYAVEISFIELRPDIRDILEDKYCKRKYMTWEQAADLHHTSISQIHRWRRNFVYNVGRRLGFMLR